MIVVVVDADGRLHTDAPRFAAAHFADERVGGVQALVRMYNRDQALTKLQDVEFGVYGYLYTWLLWPAFIRATARQLTDRRSWAKTEREVVTDAAGPPRPPAARA